MNGLLKHFLRQRAKFPLSTIFMAVDEWTYHTNQGNAAVADLDTFMNHVGKYSQKTIDGDELEGHSLYYSQTLRKDWADLCVCDANFPKDCQCTFENLEMQDLEMDETLEVEEQVEQVQQVEEVDDSAQTGEFDGDEDVEGDY